jgi:hypothetical protein|nr:MAG TPA: hypothetical protein [Caudoviricetes sp.]
MTIIYSGPFIRIFFEANELSEGHTKVQLADGYTYERIFINDVENISELTPYMKLCTCRSITFPVVNSKSPSILPLFIQDISKPAEIRLTIEKFGQIPDPQYFFNAFEPILVTGDDGNEYKVIPSDQFK